MVTIEAEPAHSPDDSPALHSALAAARLARSAAAAAAAAAAKLGTAACLAATALLLGGCVSEPQRLELKDSKSRDADFLATFRPEPWKRNNRGPSRGFEVGYQQDSNAGTQGLRSGDAITFGNRFPAETINGPDLLLQNSKLVAWHFGYTDRLYFGPMFELDISAGGMRLDFEYSLRPASGVIGTQSYARDHTWPFGAVTPRLRFGPHLALEARLALAGSASEDDQHRRLDAALLISPLPHVSLRLGYSSRRTAFDVFDDATFYTRTKLLVRGRGPTAGLRIDF